VRFARHRYRLLPKELSYLYSKWSKLLHLHSIIHLSCSQIQACWVMQLTSPSFKTLHSKTNPAITNDHHQHCKNAGSIIRGLSWLRSSNYLTISRILICLGFKHLPTILWIQKGSSPWMVCSFSILDINDSIKHCLVRIWNCLVQYRISSEYLSVHYVFGLSDSGCSVKLFWN
jgi:hypothetical protein